jgi:hypothetical protein
VVCALRCYNPKTIEGEQFKQAFGGRAVRLSQVNEGMIHSAAKVRFSLVLRQFREP